MYNFVKIKKRSIKEVSFVLKITVIKIQKNWSRVTKAVVIKISCCRSFSKDDFLNVRVTCFFFLKKMDKKTQCLHKAWIKNYYYNLKSSKYLAMYKLNQNLQIQET